MESDPPTVDATNVLVNAGLGTISGITIGSVFGFAARTGGTVPAKLASIALGGLLGGIAGAVLGAAMGTVPAQR